MRYAKRRTEYLMRRLVAKHAIALVTGRTTDPSALAGIDVGNAQSGAPYVLVDGAPLDLDVSITDRAGWAVCAIGAAVGCDLELVEPRSDSFVRDFLTGAEQRFVAAQPPGEPRDTAANLVWSAKESALKVMRTGLRRNTRSLEVSAGRPGDDGWGTLCVRGIEGAVYPGWWRGDGRYLLTVAAAAPAASPIALDDPRALATAVPRHSWLSQPLHH